LDLIGKADPGRRVFSVFLGDFVLLFCVSWDPTNYPTVYPLRFIHPSIIMATNNKYTETVPRYDNPPKDVPVQWCTPTNLGQLSDATLITLRLQPDPTLDVEETDLADVCRKCHLVKGDKHRCSGIKCLTSDTCGRKESKLSLNTNRFN
jgi:hypothetical protein